MAKKPAKKAPVKKAAPYSAAGLSRAGVKQEMHNIWYKRTGHGEKPWPAVLKAKMIKRCNGATTIHDVRKNITRLADEAAA